MINFKENNVKNNSAAKILVTVECKNGSKYSNEEIFLEEVRNYFHLDDICPIELEHIILKYGECRVGDYYDPEGPYWIRVVK